MGVPQMRVLQWKKLKFTGSYGLLVYIYVFGFFLFFTLVTFRYTLFEVLRADHAVTFSVIKHVEFTWGNLPRIMFVEFFGDKRFQPLAYLLHYFQLRAFGSEFLLYHLVSILLHVLNATLLFVLVRISTGRKTIFSIVIAALFLTAFTHLDVISWPHHFYILLQVTLVLIAVLCFFRFHAGSGARFLFFSYAFLCIQMFLYEPGVVFPGVLFLVSLIVWWRDQRKRTWIRRSAQLVAITYLLWGASLLAFLSWDTTSIWGDFTSWASLKGGLASVAYLFVNTVFLHNVVPTPRVAIDELVFLVPFTTESFLEWPTSIGIILSFWLLVGLFALVKWPQKSRLSTLSLLLLSAVAYSLVISWGRSDQYAITQSRYAYFPTLVFVVFAAHFFEGHFGKEKNVFTGHKLQGIAVLTVLCLFIGLNTAKTWQQLDEVAEHRAYTNDIFYSVKKFISSSANREDVLFVSIPSDPHHEKLSWGSDIILDLFFSDNPHLTKNPRYATHVLRAPRIIEEIPKKVTEPPDDEFTAIFGLFYYGSHPTGRIEVFGDSEMKKGAQIETDSKRWFVRLDFPSSARRNAATTQTGLVYIELGYRVDETESVVFSSQPVPVHSAKMNHFVLGKEGKIYYLIFNSKLVDKSLDTTRVDLPTLRLPLGPAYRREYRGSYYFVHTFVQLGESLYSALKKPLGCRFSEINFRQWGCWEWALFQCKIR